MPKNQAATALATALLIGIATTCYGVWMIYPPAALITAGLAITAAAILTDL